MTFPELWVLIEVVEAEELWVVMESSGRIRRCGLLYYLLIVKRQNRIELSERGEFQSG